MLRIMKYCVDTSLRGWILKRKQDGKTQDIELELTGVAVYSNFATRTDTQK